MFKPGNTSTTVQVLQKCVPDVRIYPDALTKMQLYVEECEDEIGWLGIGYRDEATNVILITDVFLFDQEVHSTTTEISPEGLGKFGEQLLQTEEGMEIWNNLKVWGHSHVNMGTSPSKTDDSQMETFAEIGHDWFIRIIANKKSDMRIDLYYYDQGIIYHNLPWSELASDEEEEIRNEIFRLQEKLANFQSERMEAFKTDILREMKQKVHKKTPSYATINQDNVYGYGQSYWRNRNADLYKRQTTTATQQNNNDDIKKPQDVYNFFNEAELFELGTCSSIDELEAQMNVDGFNPGAFSFSEKSFIWSEARKIYFSINELDEMEDGYYV